MGREKRLEMGVERDQGSDCIDVSQEDSNVMFDSIGIRHNAKTQPMTSVLGSESERDALVIGSSEQVHVVDALAITGDEGRGSLRKASGSWQTSIDPKMSEWGNPLRMEYP